MRIALTYQLVYQLAISRSDWPYSMSQGIYEVNNMLMPGTMEFGLLRKRIFKIVPRVTHG